MATNPMQRKARNSFLLGMLLMLAISGVIIAVLVLQLMNRIKKDNEELASMKNVYVLNKDVHSGQVITTDMLTIQSVNSKLIPSNATSDISIIENYSLQDKEGNDIYMKENQKDDNGNYKLYIKIPSRGRDKEFEVKTSDTGNYYIEDNNENVFIELNTVPLVAKVDMNKNTVITTELLSKSDNMVQNDVRKQEYNMIVLPSDLITGDYIDIRLMLPSGQDYIVVSKKEVEIPNINGVDSEDIIWVNLSEDEILHMSCAIIDAYQVNGAKLYATKYTEAGMQIAATPTYPANASTLELLQKDPNILEKAMNNLASRYDSTNGVNLRNNYINGVIESQTDQAQSNLETNMQESITNSKNSRKEYLDSLAGVVQ